MRKATNQIVPAVDKLVIAYNELIDDLGAIIRSSSLLPDDYDRITSIMTRIDVIDAQLRSIARSLKELDLWDRQLVPVADARTTLCRLGPTRNN